MSSKSTVDFLSRRCLLQEVGAAACIGLPGLRTAWAVKSGVTIRFSHVVAEDTPKGLAIERFKALVESRSSGRIQLLVYPGASLYSDHDEMQALQLGAVEMLAPSLSKFGRIGFPEFELFDVPYLFSDLDAVRRVTQGSVGQRLLAGLMRQRLVGLGFMDNGFKQMSANHPLLEPAHFRGLRMRVQASRVISAQMRALGAKPVTLGFSETRRALAAGVVDGTENPVSNFWTQRMHEVQTDFSLTQHGYLGYAVVANQRFWSSLTSADRKLVSASLAEALGFGNQIANLQNDKALTALRAVGTTRIHVLDGDQLARMRQAVFSVHADLARRIGRTWLDDVQALLANSKG